MTSLSIESHQGLSTADLTEQKSLSYQKFEGINTSTYTIKRNPKTYVIVETLEKDKRADVISTN